MQNHNKLLMLIALSITTLWLLLPPAVSAQSTVVVDGTYSVSGTSSNGTAYFAKAPAPYKQYSIGNTKLNAILTELNAQGTSPTANVQFVLIGNPTNPAGGLFERFPSLQIPILGTTASSVASNTAPNAATEFKFYDSNNNLIYGQKYENFSDFPKYPLSPLSNLNALLGSIFIVNFADIGLPPATNVAKVNVNFSLHQPGKIAIGDGGLLIPGTTVISKNKINFATGN